MSTMSSESFGSSGSSNPSGSSGPASSADLGLWSAGQRPDETLGWPNPFDEPKTTRRIHPADGLVTMVESEIIPRLMLAHRSRTTAEKAAIETERAIGPDTAEAFARMVISKEPDSLIAFVGGLLQAGVPLDTIYADLLVPAARRLGEYWDEDSVSFTDVTVGLGRLQQVVRALGWKTPPQCGTPRFSRSAYFAPAPREQHLFGLFIVEDFFRRAGWQTWLDTHAASEDLVDVVGSHWFDVFGLSASQDTYIEEITANIKAIRKASRNPDIFILVGGKVFIDQPELVSSIGADATAATGGEALLLANHALLLANNGVSALISGA